MEQQPQQQEENEGHRSGSAFVAEDDDPINISKDDSEDFAVEDTAFFLSTTSEPSSADLLSPVPSPTPFGTPRVWSAHSLYGEALLQSTRPLSTSNNTCSPADEDEKMLLGPQQPFIPEEEDPSSAVYEDLQVSPASPASETPTTPPSVARKPSLSPPPLILPELTEDVPTPAMLPAPTTALPPDTMSYSSKTPNRPPRVPGNSQATRPATATVSTANNNGGHVRQHRRNGSDSSVMSGLTDITFGSVQTAPPPPRSLPLPLLSAASSWTRYTNAGPGNHLPVLDNHTVSGMNITVPENLQQPILGDEDNVPVGNETLVGNSTSNNNNNNSTPTHRQSTPPRHRPPKDRPSPSQSKVAKPRASPQFQQRIPAAGGSGMAASAASSQVLAARQQRHAQKIGSPAHGSSTETPDSMTFKPIQQRVRSYSYDATESRASPVVTKMRSFSSDVVPLRTAERHTHGETQSLPGMSLVSPATWKSSRDAIDDNERLDAPTQLKPWLAQAFSKTVLSTRRTDRFGTALLAMDASPWIVEHVQDTDPPLRKIASATSTTTEASRVSNNTRHEVLETRFPIEQQASLNWTEWAVMAGILAILVGRGMAQGSEGVGFQSLAFAGLGQPLLLWIARALSDSLFHNLQTHVGVWGSRLEYETRVCLFLSHGWPSVLVFWAILQSSLYHSCGIVSFSRQASFVTTLQMSVVACVAGVLETIRRYVVGRFLHVIMYRRFERKIQRTLQRIAALRSIARFARIPASDCFTVVYEGKNEEDSAIKLDDLVVLQKIYATMLSERCLSFEFGPVGNVKERASSASTLYDALAVQGRVRLATLQEAAIGNDLLSSLIAQMFPSPANGVISQADFVATVERLHKSVEGLVNAAGNGLTLLGTVDTGSACVLNAFSFCIGFGLFSLLPIVALYTCVITVVALAVAFVLSSFFEGAVFALFTRPFDVGDTIILNRPDDPHPTEHEQRWSIEKVGFWNTVVQSQDSRSEATVLSNPNLARYRITTFDNTVLATVPVRFSVPSGASPHKLQVFRKAVEQYLLDHCAEWNGLVSMDAVDVQKTCTEYELLVRHRQPTSEFRILRESRMNLLNFCYQAQIHLGLSILAGVPIPAVSPKNTTATYNDDLSEDSIMNTDNELYFLGDAIQ